MKPKPKPVPKPPEHLRFEWNRLLDKPFVDPRAWRKRGKK